MKSGVDLTCPCGKVFFATGGRGKYCSRTCLYKFRVMPKRPGWKPPPNTGQFKKGIKYYPEAGFQKGLIPKNFKGSAAGYDAIHDWVARHLGPAKKRSCEHCGGKQNMHWANKSWEYKRDLSDWMPLCAKCHSRYDRDSGNWGATKKFKELAGQRERRETRKRATA